MIKKLFHLSDIHIRNGDIEYSRYNEYLEVFYNLFNEINKDIENYKLKKDEILIIITGDIFHNKNNIGNYGLMLYKILVENLTKIAYTIILEGNHDSIQHEINQPSLVTSTLVIDNLLILQESKSFIIDNLGFSYVNIRDTLDNLSSSGRKKNLDNFPIIDDIDNLEYKIALFHGTFANVKLYNGTYIQNTSNPYPLTWIEKFDLALLGDIHLRQKGIYKNLLWCYSGSLIQQNFGEDILEHGYVIWDLENKTIIEKNVYNKIGKIVLKQENDIILLRKTNNFVNLEKYIENNIKLFPKNIEIKFQTNYDYYLLDNLLNKYNINYKIISKNNNNIFSKKNINDNNINFNYIDNNNLLNYFKQHLNNEQFLLLDNILNNFDNLLFDFKKYPDELHSECNKKNKDISLYINNCILSQDNKKNKSQFEILYLEWENLYCYQNNNWINFDNLLNSTFLISGNNGIGKSAIYDILCLAIWGDITIDKQNDINSGIINYNSNNGYTIIELYIDNNFYKIKKEFNRKKDNNLLIKISTFLYIKQDNNIYKLIKKDHAAKEYIINLFGTLNYFLSSSMITQNIDNNILKMNYKDCIKLIDNATNIDYIYNLYNLFKNSLNKYKDFNKIINSKKLVYEKLVNNYKNKNIDNIDIHKSKLDSLINQKNIFKNSIYNIDNNIIDFDINIDYDILLYNFDKKNIYDTNILFHENKDKFNKLQFFFDNLNIDYNNIVKYSKLICNNNINFNIDYNFFNNEKLFLSNYLNNDFQDLFNIDIYSLNIKLNNNISKIKDYQIIIDNLDINKPKKIDKINFDYNIIIDNILNIFKSIDQFIEFCNLNINNKNNIEINNFDFHHNDNLYNYNTFLKYKSKINNLNDNINLNKQKIDDIDNKLNDNIKLLNTFDIINQPTIKIKFKTSKSTKNYIDNFLKNINDIIQYNNDNIHTFNQFNQILEIKNKLNEYSCDEYNYDKNCKYCIKRSCVIKINNLKDKLSNLEANLDNTILKKYKNNLLYIEKYNLYNNWYKYYLINETKKNIEQFINLKINYKNIIDFYLKEINNNTNYNVNFLNYIIYLNQKYNHYHNFDIYDKWFKKYNEYILKISFIKDENISLENHLYYYNIIKPRLDNYYKFKDDFNDLLIYNSQLYLKYEIIIRENIEYNLLFNKKKLKDNFITNNKIINIDNDIIQLNLLINEYNTYNIIYNENKVIFNNLLKIENDIDTIINIIHIIIDKFKDYKKWLYQNFILKNIVHNTNNLIKLLCHNNTINFYLDFLLTENKDIIHINWLIKNNIDNNIEVISINQASGFQNFVISIALRLSLFSNNNCSQLFIDEGFTACDKDNLSVVPKFLKNLLELYNTIIVVSHIDVIKDNIDDKIEINYNNIYKYSNLEYGNKKIYIMNKKN